MRCFTHLAICIVVVLMLSQQTNSQTGGTDSGGVTAVTEAGTTGVDWTIGAATDAPAEGEPEGEGEGEPEGGDITTLEASKDAANLSFQMNVVLLLIGTLITQSLIRF
ncbi:uncharacterized protein LOC144443716 [Glandiceps talaboti]